MRVFFTNLGCKLNQAEIDDLSRRFHAAGHERVAALAEADLHVVNSCTVTHLAARDSRKIARRGRRLNGAMRTVLTGCYATDSPDEAATLDGVDLVVTNDAKDELLDRVHAAFPDAIPAASPPDDVPIPYVPMAFGHARALVKVEDGCNMRCAFCIIPSTRGRQRSRPVEDVVAEVDALGQGGYREVVVTGVQISEYAAGGRRLFDLVRALLAGTDVPRLRLTSIAPWKFDHRLLALWQDPRLCRHIHMSLQSGCTATLKRMRRPYSAAQYAELVARIREAIPGGRRHHRRDRRLPGRDRRRIRREPGVRRTDGVCPAAHLYLFTACGHPCGDPSRRGSPCGEEGTRGRDAGGRPRQ